MHWFLGHFPLIPGRYSSFGACLAFTLLLGVAWGADRCLPSLYDMVCASQIASSDMFLYCPVCEGAGPTEVVCQGLLLPQLVFVVLCIPGELEPALPLHRQ